MGEVVMKLNLFQSGAVIFVVMCLLISSNWVMIESVSGYYHYLNSTTITTTTLSLLPPTHSHSCTPSPQGAGRPGTSLEVRHKYGPCSPFKSHKNRGPTYKEIIQSDGARVESIRKRMQPKKMVGIQENEIRIPARSGESIGSGNYVITVGLGTPRKDLTLIFDTGSDLTWTQCEPCGGDNCYEQEEPKFDPSKSSTYASITCPSTICTRIPSVGQVLTACSSSSSTSSSSPNCIYKVGYGDSSSSQGFLSNDTLYLGSGSQQFVPNYLFGCGYLNKGLFKGAAGLIGLSTSKLSLLAQSHFDYFSYCLPPNPSSTGYLTFGKGQSTATTGMQYTPLLKTSPTGVDPNLYFIELQGIQVDGKDLTISPTVFSTGGTIIDSGTVITRLPQDAYTALKEAFTDGMSSYPKVPTPQGDLFDTCFNLNGYDNVTIPVVSLLFGGGARMDLPSGGILIPIDNDYQYCLAFATTSDVTILGNTQQLGFDIVYDIVGSKLGFAPAPNGCT